MDIICLKDIDNKSREGKLLLVAIAQIAELRGCKPHHVIQELNVVRDKIWLHKTSIKEN